MGYCVTKQLSLANTHLISDEHTTQRLKLFFLVKFTKKNNSFNECLQDQDWFFTKYLPL